MYRRGVLTRRWGHKAWGSTGACRYGNYGTCLLVRERTEGVLYALKRIPIGNGKKEESQAALREAQVRPSPHALDSSMWEAVDTAILTTAARDVEAGAVLVDAPQRDRVQGELLAREQPVHRHELLRGGRPLHKVRKGSGVVHALLLDHSLPFGGS
jgi:hypothetical protein